MPGSPESDLHPIRDRTRPLHPLAWILALALLGAGLAVDRSWIDLGVAASLLALAALRAEGKTVRGEVPLLALALLVFTTHVIASRGARSALGGSAAIAFRLLALVYLLRWAARGALGRAARWLMGMRPPSSPRVLVRMIESARLTAALLPLALREAEQHVTALHARGIRLGSGLRGAARYLAAWFLPFLGTMLRVGDAYADALTTRGYRAGGARRSGLALAWGLREWGAVLGSAASAAWLLRGA